MFNDPKHKTNVEMLVENVTSILPQTCKCESDAEHSAQITEVCCTLSGHIGGIVDEYRSPLNA